MNMAEFGLACLTLLLCVLLVCTAWKEVGKHKWTGRR